MGVDIWGSIDINCISLNIVNNLHQGLNFIISIGFLLLQNVQYGHFYANIHSLILNRLLLRLVRRFLLLIFMIIFDFLYIFIDLSNMAL